MTVGAPTSVDGWTGYQPGDRAELTDVQGYQTFRQVALLGETADTTTIGLGVRARLPFRVFLLGSRNEDFQLVVDVAHRWTPPRCTWRVDLLPTGVGGGTGRVNGTDGGRRWAGVAGNGAALWQDGRLSPLGPGRALDVNRGGTVVGADAVGTGQGHAALWAAGRRLALAEPSGVTRSQATAINDAGVIVGWGVRGSAEDQDGPSVGLVWSQSAPGRVTEVRYAQLDVGLTGVSDSGVLFGNGAAPGQEEGPRVALQGTLATGLQPLNPSEVHSVVTAAAGGYAVGSGSAGGTVWQAGTGAVVRTRPGLLPTDVNRHGDVAALNAGTLRPLLWSGDDLEPLPVPAGWSGASAAAIDDAGRLAGELRREGGQGRPALWTCG